jgi:hypothetical protein
MKVFKKKPQKVSTTRSDALNAKPVKNSQIIENRSSSGEITIHYPVTMRPLIARLAKHLGQPHSTIQTKKLQLDHLGANVWELIDGKRSVRRIIEEFAEAQQLQRREAEMAVTQFLRQLGQRGLIGMQ